MLNHMRLAKKAMPAVRTRLFSTREFLQRMDGDVVDPAVAQSNRAALTDVQQDDAAKCVTVKFLASS
jgi:hypothetical protein